MVCKIKKTKYQPTDEEFICPDCGSNLYIEYTECSDDCEELHETDILFCEKCYGDRRISYCGLGANSFVRSLIKKKKLVPCEHCKGKGFVKKS